MNGIFCCHVSNTFSILFNQNITQCNAITAVIQYYGKETDNHSLMHYHSISCSNTAVRKHCLDA